MKKIISVIVSLVSASALASSNVPREFQDFFDETEQSIYVTLAGERDGKDIDALVNYDKFKLEDGSIPYLELERFLLSKGLKFEAVDQVLSQSVQGIITDSECNSGRLARCVLDSSTQKIRYVFDFDNSVLKLFVPPGALSYQAGEREFESYLNDKNALVNWSNLYVSTDLNGNDQFTASNYTTLGLPIGHVTLDSQYKSRENELEIYQALYDAEYRDVRFQVGHSNYNPSFNSTDYLSSGASYDGDGLHVGSSTNLLKGNPKSQQKIDFYAPENGQLEVYRDERLVINRVVSQGKQTITYAELPTGVYDATILLKVAGKTVLSEKIKVVNNNQFSLGLGSLDYALSVGRFKFNDFEDYNGYANYNRDYIKGLLNYRLTEDLFIGTGFTSNDSEQYYQLGGVYMLGNSAKLDYAGGVFSRGDMYNSLQFSVAPFYFYASQLKLNDDTRDFGLANQLYGTENNTHMGVSINGRLWGGTGYLRYGWYQTSDLSDEDFYESHNVSGGYSYRLPKGHISVNMDYVNSLQSKDELRGSITYVLELGDGYSTQFSAYGNKDGFDSNTNYLHIDKQWGNWRSNNSIGAQVNHNNQVSTDLSSSISGSTDYFNANAYGYVNDSGRTSLSGGISGTQTVSLDGVGFTNKRGRSFVRVKSQSDDGNPEEFDDIKLEVKRDGRYNRRKDLNSGSTMIPLDEYSDLQLTVDAGSNNIEIVNNQFSVFSRPGTVYELDSKVIRLLSRTVILDDINGQPIDNLQCIGDGCVGVEPLTNDGVFRVNYKGAMPYHLVSRKGLCVVEPEDKYAQGYCLPGLDNEDSHKWDSSSNLLSEVSNEDLLVYLGRFKSGHEASTIKDKLDANRITYKSIEVANEVFVYIMDGQEFTQAQMNLLNELDAYVLLRGTEIDLLTIKSYLGNTDEEV